jgi:hypothetical protein
MRRLGAVPAMLLLLLTLAGCSLHSDEKRNSPAPTATQAAAATAIASAAAVAGLNPTDSQTISDGICTTLIPENWIVSNNGRGFSPSGARFTLFGNKLSGDAAWTAAAGIVATIAAGKDVQAIQTADSVTFANAAGTSFEVRRRLSDRYCDFSVSSTRKAPDEERALWPAIGASMAAAPENNTPTS